MIFNDIVYDHIRTYPMMEPIDAVKLAYQSEFGPAHMISDIKHAEKMVERERAETKTKPAPLFCHIGNGYVRLDLSSEDAAIYSSSLIARIFAASASDVSGTREELLYKLEIIRGIAKEGAFSFSPADFDRYLEEYAAEGYPMVSHSSRYKEVYAPAYRVIKHDYVRFLPLLSSIEQKIANSVGEPVLVAIDGHAAAGKSTLARLICSVFDCNVIQMDDFFLPPSMRTDKRLNEAGGNVHYERFMEEVILPLKKNTAFSYGIFDCSVMSVKEKREVEPKILNIIEGSYSCHPFFQSPYDIQVFLDITQNEQMERILERNGSKMAERFREVWIPMENRYFEQFSVKEKCDFLFG